MALLIKKIGAKAVAEIMQKVILKIGTKLALKQLGKKAAQLPVLLIPGLDILFAIDTLVDIAGPAFRKTVPTVVEVALLRLEYGNTSEG